ncbi:MAG: hypothetical protein HN580_24375 [Deltaproteobacteria bacterium]|nr:hypothetical protein [Deltaproteobacteria bacterium]MBT4089715.1 hypothetical protein [Deltaproteobacteria bacterium]MBT4264336.1 hypothetical protein [Deltaproteobacteria bacterium]MBT4642502.1 hypothetical protein [Deltaproteobacteria bacterium]MBT6500892.1 hypothetical protein [Deltaproteobacteria bacterium]
MIPETMDSNLRELIVSNYRIMYQVSERFITVFRVHYIILYLSDKPSA